ncbi:hypothetical protein [Erwinia sp. Leaf53]|uniref:hypothetical protein n=1 Tax=Erwinia sp. Leaf53 TaxID=1736225 RepID=UPI00092EF5F2|nr:hypothetical protein [Erwinia sp. Leaf53]
MRERGIIFNAEMVRAILDGRKTQTRRIVKGQRTGEVWSVKPAGVKKHNRHTHDWWLPTGSLPYSALPACPFGQPGDRLWVRETWSEDFANYYPNDRVWYAANDDRRRDIEIVDGVRGIYSPESDVHVPFRWRPSIHMPRWASRITLEITGVRVERLYSISEPDAVSEGLSPIRWYSHPTEGVVRDTGGMVATIRFKELWSSIYGVDSWQANPWVWVVEFKRVEDGQP